MEAFDTGDRQCKTIFYTQIITCRNQYRWS